MIQQKSILLTFDVEDWFQVENLREFNPFSSWSSREIRAEENTKRILETLSRASEENSNGDGSKRSIKATFFILGWLAEKLPGLVRQIHSEGHEIASHGFNHELCYSCSPAHLRRDLTDCKKLLEDITGEKVHGYRAPNFSVNRDVLSIIEECGFTYDSSYNSFSMHKRYGKLNLACYRSGIAYKISPSLYELPISNMRIGKMVLPIGGGGYFRLIPVYIFLRAIRRILDSDNAYLFYLHPWEVDPGQPIIRQAPFSFRFRHYLNLHKSLPRLEYLLKKLSDFQFVSCYDYIGQSYPAGTDRALQ